MLQAKNRKNKKGWIRIVEAFVALLLIMGVLLVVINKGYIGKKDISQQVYEVQIGILREVELDDSLRNELLEVANLPADETALTTSASNTINKIKSRLPDYLDCETKLCELDKICALENYPDKDIYAQAVAISATLEKYQPRQLKLFCWVKG